MWAAVVGPSFSVLIIRSLGASSAQIGIFAAVCAVFNMVVQPFWGFLSDKTGSPRRVMCFCMGVSALFFGSSLLAGNLYTAAGLLVMDTIFRCSVTALLDSHILSGVNTIPGLQYSHIRPAGSIFFGSLSFIYSRVIHTWTVMTIIPISVCISALAIFWGLFAAKGRWEDGPNRNAGIFIPRRNLKKDVLDLLRNKNYIALVIFIGFSALATSPLFVFIVDYVAAAGGNPGDVPLIHTLRCIVELPAFILITSLGKRTHPIKLMLAGMGVYIIYIGGLLFAHTYFILAACHMAGAAGFILILTGRMRYLNQITPPAVRSTSITVLGAFEVGIGSVVGNLVAGSVSQKYGINALTIVSLSALLVAIVTVIRMGSSEQVTVNR
ncbi:MAG: MFS transporter [Treponema sp.]|nr:MFS transporter [Treponema sp.]